MACQQLVVACLLVFAALQLASTAPRQSTPVTGTSTSTLYDSTHDSDKEALAPFLGKKYWLDHCDNIGGGLGKLVKLNETMTEALLQQLTGSIMLDEHEGNYTTTTELDLETIVHTETDSFRIGQEREKSILDDGIISKVIVTRNGNSLITFADGKFIGNMTFSADNVKTVEVIKNITLTCKFIPKR